MEICRGSRKSHHDEIVYECGDCPLCSAMDEFDDALTTIESLEKELVKKEKED